MLNHSDDREIKSLGLSDGLTSKGIPIIVPPYRLGTAGAWHW